MMLLHQSIMYMLLLPLTDNDIGTKSWVSRALYWAISAPIELCERLLWWFV